MSRRSVTKWLFLFLLGTFPIGTCVFAQTIPIRSGEHEEFSRLVMPVPSPTDWTVLRDGATYVVRLSADGSDFDTSQVFSRLTKGRIAGIASDDDGVLRIEPDCACHIDAFIFENRYLVLDIKDGAPDADSPFEQPLARLEEEGTPALILPIVPEPTRTTAQFQMHDPDPELATPSRDLSSVEGDLLESIARAASQGLLDASAGTHAMPEAKQEELTDTQEKNPDEASDSAPEEMLQGSAGIRTETVIDRDAPAFGRPTEPTSQGGTDCLPDSAFALFEWAGSGDFEAEIANRRAELTTEFDQYPDGAIVRMAQTFIAFGFGREAVQALALDGKKTPERQLLIALAHIIDDDPKQEPALTSQITCPTAASFWSLIEAAPAAGSPRPDTRVVLNTYRSLPADLRAQLGVKLSERLTTIGDLAGAEQALRWATSPESETSLGAEVVVAEIAVAQGDTDAALSTLSQVAAQDERLTPEAMLRLLDLSHADGRTVDDSVLTLSESLRYESRHAPVAVDLFRAEVVARLDREDFDGALAQLDTAPEGMAVEDYMAIVSDTAEALAEGAPDITFLRHVVSGFPTDINSKVENDVARRLLSLGFADRAAQFILSEARGPDMGERRYLRAEAENQLGNPDEALRQLSGLSDLRAARLRASAQASKGDFGAAFASENAADGSALEVETAWRAGAWARLAGSEDPLLRDVGASMMPQDANRSGPVSLQLSRDALQSAEATRKMVDDLLTRFGSPSVDAASGL